MADPTDSTPVDPSGFRLRLSPHWLIEEAHGDLPAGFGKGASLADLLGGDAAHELRNQLSLVPEGGSAFLFALATRAGTFDFAIDCGGRLIRLDVRPAAPADPRDWIGTVRGLIDRLHRATDAEAALARLAKALTGYSRIGYYRRGDDGSMALRAQTARSFDAVLDAVTVETLLARPRACSDTLCLALGAADRPSGLLLCEDDRPREPSFAQIAAFGLFAQMAAMTLALKERG